MAETQIHLNRLAELYYANKESRAQDVDVVSIDITEVFWKTLQEIIDEGKTINIAIRGEVAHGKSTVAIALMYRVNKYLRNKGIQKEKVDIYKHIFSEQTEFIRYINQNEQNV